VDWIKLHNEDPPGLYSPNIFDNCGRSILA